MSTGEWFLGGTTIFLGLIAVAAIITNVWANKKNIRENRRAEATKRELEIKSIALDDLKTWTCEISDFIVFFGTAYGSEAREAATRIIHLMDEGTILSVSTQMFDNKSLRNLFKDLVEKLIKLNSVMTSEPPDPKRKLIKDKEDKAKTITDVIISTGTKFLTEIAKEKVKLYSSRAN